MHNQRFYLNFDVQLNPKLYQLLLSSQLKDYHHNPQRKSFIFLNFKHMYIVHTQNQQLKSHFFACNIILNSNLKLDQKHDPFSKPKDYHQPSTLANFHE